MASFGGSRRVTEGIFVRKTGVKLRRGANLTNLKTSGIEEDRRDFPARRVPQTVWGSLP